MAVVGSNLVTSSSTTDGLTFATASVTPTANALILIAVGMTVAASPTPTLTSVVGNGITYTQIDTTVPGARTIALFRGMAASPTAGAITITAPSTLTSCYWTVAQFTGVDTSGTNGSGAIVQTINGKPASSLTPSQAFTTTPNAANAGFGAIITAGTISAGSAGTGWTLAGNANQTAPVSWQIGEYANASCPAAITATFTGTAGASFVVGAEILPGGAAGVTPAKPRQANRARFRASFW